MNANNYWWGPSPGTLGWLLHEAGLLGDRAVEAEVHVAPMGFELVHRAVCPLCGGQAFCASRRDDELALGVFDCRACAAGKTGDFDDTLQERVLEFFASGSDCLDPEAMLANARARLAEALPPVISLGLPLRDLVDSTMRALERMGYNGSWQQKDLELALNRCARWRNRSGRRMEQPTKPLREAVENELRTNVGLAVAVSGLEYHCVRLDREGLTSAELVEHEPELGAELSKILGGPQVVDARQMGYLLRKLAAAQTNDSPRLASRTVGGGWTRWSVQY